MKNFLLSAFILLCNFSIPTFAQDTEKEFVFRNDDRPEYSKNITVDDLNSMQQSEDITLIDVRLAEDFALDPTLIPGATYNDPELITEWAKLLPKDKKIVLYCVKGAWVSHKAATYLSNKGYDVSTLNGGIRQWKSLNSNKE